MAENPTKEMLEISGSVANLCRRLGAAGRPLRVRKVIRVKKARQDFQEELRKAGVRDLDLPVDEHRRRVGTADGLELWLAEGTFRRSW